MKRLKYMFAAALLLAALTLNGCGSKPAQTTTEAGTEQTVIAEKAVTDAGSDSESAAQTDATKEASEPEKAASAADKTDKKTTVEAAPGDKDTTAKDTAAKKTTAAETTAKGTTQKEIPTLKPGTAATTKAAAPAKPDPTAKAGSTDKTASTTEAAADTKTTDPTSSVKPISPSSTTQAKPVPVAKGNAVAGNVTFLNEAEENYVSGLTEKQLEAFGITGDAAKKVTKKPEDWSAYTIRIDFENKETMPVTLYYLNVTDNGKDQIYINGEIMGELGLPIKGKTSQEFHVLAPSSISDGFVLAKLHKMKMDIQYAATPQDDSVMPSFVYAPVK